MTLQEIINTIRGADAIFEKYEDDGLVPVWEKWYRGKSAFHNYNIYNGKEPIKMTRKSLGMAKRACEDWASLLLNEKTDVSISDKETANNVNKIFEDTQFWKKANAGLEKSFALGGGALVLTVEVGVRDDGSNAKDGTIGISFFNRKRYIPVTIKDGEIVECAFYQVDGKNTKLSLHRKNEATGNYEIVNATASGTNLDSLALDPSTVYIFDTKSQYPLYAILEPNTQNNIDIDSPFGISIFANAIDIMKGIDLIYDSEINEYALGRKRIFTTATKTETDMATGKQREVFDSNDVVFYMLPESMDGENLIKDNTQALRIEEHETGIQANLNRFSAAVGFGNNRYRYDQGSVATATQVISENSDMFRNIRKHEILLNDRLVQFIKALLRVANEFTAYEMNESANIEIKFDDSIIEDKGAQMASDRLDVSMRVMSKAEYRAKWYNEDLETAKKAIDEIDSMSIPDDPDDDDDGSGV